MHSAAGNDSRPKHTRCIPPRHDQVGRSRADSQSLNTPPLLGRRGDSSAEKYNVSQQSLNTPPPLGRRGDSSAEKYHVSQANLEGYKRALSAQQRPNPTPYEPPRGRRENATSSLTAVNAKALAGIAPQTPKTTQVATVSPTLGGGPPYREQRGGRNQRDGRDTRRDPRGERRLGDHGFHSPLLASVTECQPCNPTSTKPSLTPPEWACAICDVSLTPLASFTNKCIVRLHPFPHAAPWQERGSPPWTRSVDGRGEADCAIVIALLDTGASFRDYISPALAETLISLGAIEESTSGSVCMARRGVACREHSKLTQLCKYKNVVTQQSVFYF